MPGALIIAPIAALVALYVFQDRLILQPDFALESWKASAAQARHAVPWQEQGRYLGKIHEPEVPAKGTIILYHGNAGTVDHRADLARELSSRGFRTVLVEYPGYGEREGRATVSNLLSASLQDFTLALGRWPGPVYVFGESLGAGIAAQVVRNNPDRIAGAALFTPWDSLARLANEKLFPLPVDFLLRRKLDSTQALAGYKGRLAIISAESDTVIPVEHARALAAALPAALYLELSGAGHNNWLSHLHARDWETILDAVTAPVNATP
jgi:uncharacterized protein